MAAEPVHKRVRTRHFQNAKESGLKFTGLTSYDQLTASIFDAAGIDFLLVGGCDLKSLRGLPAPSSYESSIPASQIRAGNLPGENFGPRPAGGCHVENHAGLIRRFVRTIDS